jgi:hypothetical protein
MTKPNVNFRTREVGWWFGNTNGSLTNLSGSGQNHGVAPPLGAGATAITYRVQLVHAQLGGAALFSRGFVYPITLEPTRHIILARDAHPVYLSLSAHLRGDSNVDLPGKINIFTNDLWPTAAAVANPDTTQIGDWRDNAWQEWEDQSPLGIPTPPPGFSSGGAAGIRYEYRRRIGRLESNFFYCQITNLGTVPATEWGIGVFLRSYP